MNRSDPLDKSIPSLYDHVLDHAPFGILILSYQQDQENKNYEFQCRYANERAGHLLETTVSSLENKGIRGFSIPGLTEKLTQLCRKVFETGEKDELEFQFEKNDFLKTLLFNIIKIPEGVSVFIIDGSEEVDARNVLRAKGRLYRKLFEESIDPIFVMDASFGIIEANSSFLQFFQYPAAVDNLGKIDELFIQPEKLEAFKVNLKTDGKIEELETFLICKSGQKKYCLINCVDLEEREDERSYLGILRDMTKRRNADKKLVMAEKLSMTGKIARTIGHEVRNPLTNLTLAVEQLKDELDDDHEQAEVYINIAQRNIKRIEKLITDLLNSSKPKEIKPLEQSLNQLVSDSLNLVRDRLNLQQIELVEEYEDELPAVFLDEDQMKIALLNLYINAIEAMKQGEGRLTVTTTSRENEVLLIVQDNGIGIPEDKIDRLFEPYYTEKKGGTGLGLTSVQNIIQGHQGYIEVESEPGKGTSFTIGFTRVM